MREVRRYCNWYFNWPGDKDETYSAMFAFSADSCGFLLAAPFIGEVMGNPHRTWWRAVLLDWQWTWVTWSEIKAMNERNRAHAEEREKCMERVYFKELTRLGKEYGDITMKEAHARMLAEQ